LTIGIGLPCVGLWWWLGRTPPDRGQFISDAWRDEHVRGRREGGK
jgi:hypothetical protein